MKKAIGKKFADNKYYWTGVAGVLVTVLVLAVVFGIGALAIGKTTYTADFAQAAGLAPNDKVQLAGVNVGEVKKTELEGDHVKVTMDVDNKVRINSDGVASIKLSTILGQRYVELVPGIASERLADEHFKNDGRGTQVPYNLQDLIDVGTPKISGIDSKQLTQAIAALNNQFRDAPAVMPGLLDNLAKFSGIISTRADQFNQLLTSLDTVVGVLSDSEAALRTLIGQGQVLSNKIVTNQTVVNKLLDGLAELSGELRALGAENDGRFATLVTSINTITQGLEKNRTNLRRLLEIAPVTARYLANATGDGQGVENYLPAGLFPDNWMCAARLVAGC